jgi:hypothetical protein
MGWYSSDVGCNEVSSTARGAAGVVKKVTAMRQGLPQAGRGHLSSLWGSNHGATPYSFVRVDGGTPANSVPGSV